MASIKLQGDTSGELTISAPSVAGTNTLTLPASTGTIITDTAPKAGSILQVISGEKGSTFTGTSVADNGGYFIDVTGYSATITPASTSNKILVMIHAYVGMTTAASGYQQHIRIKRGTTYPFLGDVEGGRPVASARINSYLDGQYAMNMISGAWIDSPSSTSALTYQVQLGGYSGSPIVYLNRQETFQVGTSNYDTVPLSTITLMEIAG